MLGNSYPTYIPCRVTYIPNIYIPLYTLGIYVGLHVGFVDEANKVVDVLTHNCDERVKKKQAVGGGIPCSLVPHKSR